MKPKFKHDCENCLFIGHFHEHDVYLCCREDNASIIARYGDDGPDYASTNTKFLPLPLADAEAREVPYMKAWIAAIQYLQSTLPTLQKLIDMADTLHLLSTTPNQELAS